MPITMEEHIRNIRRRVIQEATVEERLEGIPPQVILQHLSLGQLLRLLTPEQLVRIMTYDRGLKKFCPKARQWLRDYIDACPTA